MSSMTQKAEGEWEWNDDDDGEITDEESDVDEELELEAGGNGNNKQPPQTTAGPGGPNGGNVGLSPPLLRPSSSPTPLPPPIRPPFLPSNSNSNHRPLRRGSPFNLCAPSTFLLLIPTFLFIILLAQYSPQTPVGGVFGLPGLLRSSQSALEKMTVQVGAPQRTLRVMSFNIWVSGANVENGMVKIASQIKQADPDIVALQEVRTAEVARNLTQLLGSSVWKCAFHPFAPYPDTAILTKHKFVLENKFVHLQFERNISDFIFNEEHYENNSVVTYGIGATIQLEPDGQLVNFYSMHLDWRSYGPYAANNKKVTRSEQIMIGERNKEGYGRAQNIEQLLGNEEFQKHKELAGKQPLIVAGDFNAPSHLDWIEETKELHGGWAFEWPATKLMMDAGFLDSFRKIHPDVVKEPGTTWSTVQKEVGPEWDWEIPEPQDRIDFIFYVPSASFRPTQSRTYAGYAPLKPIPNQAKNEWPSDHFSVISEFQIDLAIQEESSEFEFSTQQTNSTAAEEMEGRIDGGMADRAE